MVLREILVPRNLNFAMHTQYDSGSNMGWVPLGHTSLYGLVISLVAPGMPANIL